MKMDMEVEKVYALEKTGMGGYYLRTLYLPCETVQEIGSRQGQECAPAIFLDEQEGRHLVLSRAERAYPADQPAQYLVLLWRMPGGACEGIPGGAAGDEG